MKKFLIIYVFSAVICAYGFTQNEPIQPNVMDIKKMTIAVLPYAKSDEKVLAKYEESGTLRGAILNVVDRLQKADYVNVISFVDQLAKMSDDELEQLDASSDYRKFIADKTSADILITLDPVWVPSEQLGNQMQVNFSAVESSANSFIASGTAKSVFNRAGQDQLMDKAIAGYMDEFLSSMGKGVERLQREGRPVSINVTFDAASSYNLDTYLEGHDLSIKDAIIECIEENSLEFNDPKSKGVVEMDFYNTKIPFVDSATGKTYRVIKFTQQIERYMKSKGVLCSTRISDRGTIHIVIK